MKKALLIIFILTSSSLFANNLYKAYLAGDMQKWGDYLTETDQRTDFSVQELADIANYEYGYIAWCLGEKREDEAKHRLKQFINRINRLDSLNYSPSMIAVFRSSVCAYDLSLYKRDLVKTMKDAIHYTELGVKLDSKNPLALTLQGNVKFYTPAMFGGSKKTALDIFLHAEKLMRENKMTDCWNYRALQLCIAQCYEKVESKKAAINYCEQILSEVPDFAYVRDVYLPKLLGKSTK
ncbi:MAG: hypothetical protein J6P99_05580 [Paludibacteraceae bacterium]|nr:hypothetical protein [Paludibacteraceae bacterium]